MWRGEQENNTIIYHGGDSGNIVQGWWERALKMLYIIQSLKAKSRS